MSSAAMKKQVEPEFHIAGVPSARMMDLWPHVSKYFASFEKRSRGELTAAELLTDVIEGRRQCWIATDGEIVKACGLTECPKSPMGTVVFSFCSGEDRDMWQDAMVDEIVSWAKSRGAKRVRAIHRPGWKKLLSGHGFVTRHYVSDMDI